MTMDKDSKPVDGKTKARAQVQETKPEPTPARRPLVGPGTAFLAGVVVGAAIQDEKPKGNEAHVHLSLDDEKSDCQEHHHNDHGHDDGMGL